MGLLDIIIIAFGLAMDAFAISIFLGIKMEKKDLKLAWIPSTYFGFFQGMMPLVGFLLAFAFAKYIAAYNHYLAFILLALIGAKMIRDSFEKQTCSDRKCPKGKCPDRSCPTTPFSYAPKVLLPLAISTSIDAMMVGITFNAGNVNLWLAIPLIGIITFACSLVGIFIGHRFGDKLQSRAELFGGIVLIAIGLKILLTGIL